ncbi:PepSY domain-containing protein [Duganella sp. sic0402]|uniref:PepSY-associated TM helix domain-containing protein n=1 Tax=Duganella sp. sic0402 TaxID=2854786 RepID=UPI001C44B1B3|nr:PepSY-associated TM helix domain-containing protein [Duganella sp. sic0402]MBV7537515.1 PepSY domain-containing protein [Duganella sp. sic0402]
MKDGFRQQMSWLHTWCGLTSGWLLCAIFLTGTLAVFRQPITQWMEARPITAAGAAASPGQQARALDAAAAHLAANAGKARFWRVELPAEQRGPLLLAWQGGGQAALDPASGEVLAAPSGRKTEGGRHFMSFHYMLQADTPGYWLVGWVSMCMLVALVSGVVVHRRIFQDFFTFRPGKGQRSWLDAHNVTAVLALPFLFMIVYTGLTFFYTAYMPWPLQAAYGADAYPRYQSELESKAAPARRPRGTAPAVMHPLAPLVAQAAQLMQQPARRVVVEQPGRAGMVVRVFGAAGEHGGSETIINPVSLVAFDGVSGAVLEVHKPRADAASTSADVHEVMKALHLVRFGGWSMKCLYFMSGLMGTAMMATGTILFSIKRRKKSAEEFGRATAGIYRVVEALNIASMAGIALACIVYFYANRLLPVEWAERSVLEIRVFLWCWLATLLYALLRRPMQAWIEQLALGALLCFGLPLLNYLTTGQQLFAYALAGDWQRAGVELAALGFGVALASAAWRVHGVNRAVVTNRRLPL